MRALPRILGKPTAALSKAARNDRTGNTGGNLVACVSITRASIRRISN